MLTLQIVLNLIAVLALTVATVETMRRMAKSKAQAYRAVVR